ncbi:signal peptide peptidase SppA [Bauldia sp.]|uniref:signal peptide peptidase SppA n=1 Tax=Bauldia sp. TaxID=2575872 RepID=UPI003BA98693
MNLTPDQIADRRSLRRKLSLWRVVAFIAAAIALIAATALVSGGGIIGLGLTVPQIARVSISGFITEDRAQLQMLERIADDDGVAGVIVAIDSTGGVTAGGEALYEALRRLADEKPTVATMGTVGASAAYMAAIATDHVIARRSTITGSIGVIFQYPEVGGLLDKLGIAVGEVKSDPLKAAPSLFKPPSPEALAVIQGIVGDSYNWFVDIVAERRDFARDDALVLADGRIFTGRQALDANLIDAIGGEEAALDWLEDQGVDRDLPVRDWQPERPSRSLLSADVVTVWLARQFGLAPDVPAGLDRLLPRLPVDGLMSVWQAQGGGSNGPAEGAH